MDEFSLSNRCVRIGCDRYWHGIWNPNACQQFKHVQSELRSNGEQSILNISTSDDNATVLDASERSQFL